MAVVLLASVLAAGAASTEATWPSLERLEAARKTLRDRLRARAAEDAAIEAPRDVRLDLNPGLGRGETRVLLRRQGGRWHVRAVEGRHRGMERVAVDPSGLVLKDGRLDGPLVFTWGDRGEAEDAAEDGTGDGSEEGADGAKSQTFDVHAALAECEPRLVLRFHRFKGSDWVLAYRREGDAWVFAEELEAPGALTRGGPFGRTYSPLKPDAQGRFTGRIDLTFEGDKERHGDAYTGNEPVVTFAGRLMDGRVDTTFILKAPSGKGLLGSGQDMLTGAEKTADLSGRSRSEGARGAWISVVSGMVMPAPADPVASVAADDPTAPPADTDAASVRAARVYREVCALDRSLRHYPIPLADSLARTLTPEPAWPAGAPDEAKRAYMAALARQAGGLVEPPKAEAAFGPVAPDDPTFGPFYGRACLETVGGGTAVPAAGQGPQEWRAVTGWQMVGPFSIFDQDVKVDYPELAPVLAATFRRARMFATREGEVTTIEDAAVWMAPEMDGARVAAPQVKEASAGDLRFLAWYATAELASDADQTVWLSMGLQGQGMVWINEELVWDSGRDYDSVTPAVFRVDLKKGANRLLVRCASNRASNAHGNQVDYLNGNAPRPAGRIDFTTFAMHVCVQGEPGAPAGTTVAVPPAPDGPKGYRGDGSGVWPGAEPPLAWDLGRGVNVAWRTPLPEGLAQPVVRNGRVFVTAEPNLLVCLDGETGEERWQRTVTPPEGAPPVPTRGRQATVSPVVTADRVYVHFGGGVAACFTLEGEPVWTVATEAPWAATNMGSPVLVDGRFILQAHLPGDKDDQTGRYGLMALDAKDGSRLWTARGPRRRTTTRHDRPEGLGNGLAVMRLKRGDTTRALVITGDGAVVDAASGDLLHRDIFGVEATRAAPCVVGHVVYTAPVMGEQGVTLWLDEAGRVGARTLWRNPPKYGLGQTRTIRAYGEHHWMDAPVATDGLLYVVKVDSSHVPGHYNCPWTQLEIFGTETGERVARQRANLRDATDATVPPAIAGRYLYVADGGMPVGGFGGATDTGKMAVLERLPVPPEQRDAIRMHTPTHQGAWGLACLVSRNEIGRGRAAPVFDGNRMLLRSLEGITCVAVTDEAGRAYQLEAMAKTTVSELVGQRPQPRKAVTPAPARAAPENADVPVVRAGVGKAATDWLVLGPLPRDGAAEVPKALTATGDGWLRAGTEVRVGDAALTLRRVEPAHFIEPGELDLAAAMEDNRDCEGYLATVLEIGRRQDVRYVPSAPVVGTWIGGKPVARGETVHLDVGYYPMVVRVRLERVPAFVQPKLSLGFMPPQMDFDTPEAWMGRVTRLQDRLRTICRELPGTGYARSARVSLQGAGLDAPEPPAAAATVDAEEPAEAGSAESADEPSAAPAATPTPPAARVKPEAPGESNLGTILIIAAVVAATVAFLVWRQRRPND